MNSSTERNKIIWAVDSRQNPKEAKSIIKELRIWAKHLNCDVQPVSVFSKTALNFPTEMEQSWQSRYEDFAQKSLDRYLKKAGARDFLAPGFVFAKTTSKRKMATEMAHFAEENKVLLVFAHTRAKKTWNPFRLGGFVETLVSTSKVPVLLLNPKSLASNRFSNILFATDFSRESKNAFMRLDPWANALASKILLYNQVETPNIYPLEFYGAAQTETFNTDIIVKDAIAARTKKAAKWAASLRGQNIKCTPLIRKQKKDLATDIIDTAKMNNADLIVMASSSGPLSQAILGSVPRDVLLQAGCPVLVFFRPKAVRKHVDKTKLKANIDGPSKTHNLPQAEIHSH